MLLYTIGFTKKTAEQFFDLISGKGITLLLDIRLNNKSQLAGFTKYPDLEYFLKKILGIKYIHDISLAPTKEILDDYKNKKNDWEQYTSRFENLMAKRNTTSYFFETYGDNIGGICLLCSEEMPNECHRGIIAKALENEGMGQVTHL